MIKITIVVLAFWFVYVKLVANSNLKDFTNLIRHFDERTVGLYLSVVFGLMLLNWGLEAVKWQRLIQNVEQISLGKAIESVFCGLTWAVFTPNRIGEYGGRVFFLSPKRRIVGVVAMSVGNIGQLVLTNVFGAIATCLFIYKFKPIEPIIFVVLCILAAIFAFFFLVFYFNIKWINGLLLSVKFTRKYKKFYAVLARYKKAELARILLLCLARYTVFSLQYYLLLNWLIPEIATINIIMLVCILFFVQSTLPSLDLFDIGIRSVTGLYFFKHVTQQNTAVVACIACIWLTNIILPAILGSFFVFKLNFFGNSKNI